MILNSDEVLFDLIDNGSIELNREVEEKKPSDTCPMCDSTNLVDDTTHGSVVCQDCGIILTDTIDQSAEWRNYDDTSENTARCGGPTSYFFPNSSLGTTMNCSAFNRIKILQGWSAMPYRERSLYKVLKDIKEKCNKENIKKCIADDACIMYKTISDCKYTHGAQAGKHMIFRMSNRRSLIAACVYFACKLKNTPRSHKEIAKMFELKIPELTKGCKIFKELMKTNRKINYKFNTTTAEDFVARYSSKLKIKKAYADIAVQFSHNIKKLGIASNHTPPSIASASILLMAQLHNIDVTKKAIADAFKISDTTMLKAMKEILPWIKVIVNDKKTDRVCKIIKKEKEIFTKNQP